MNKKSLLFVILAVLMGFSPANSQRELVGNYITGGGPNFKSDLQLKASGEYTLSWSNSSCEAGADGKYDSWFVRELGTWRVNLKAGTVVIKSLHIKGNPEGDYASLATGEYRLVGDQLVPIDADAAGLYRPHWLKLGH